VGVGGAAAAARVGASAGTAAASEPVSGLGTMLGAGVGSLVGRAAMRPISAARVGTSMSCGRLYRRWRSAEKPWRTSGSSETLSKTPKRLSTS
jgi:hypothetical protein